MIGFLFWTQVEGNVKVMTTYCVWQLFSEKHINSSRKYGISQRTVSYWLQEQQHFLWSLLFQDLGVLHSFSSFIHKWLLYKWMTEKWSHSRIFCYYGVTLRRWETMVYVFSNWRGPRTHITHFLYLKPDYWSLRKWGLALHQIPLSGNSCDSFVSCWSLDNILGHA